MFVAGWRHALRSEWPFINVKNLLQGLVLFRHLVPFLIYHHQLLLKYLEIYLVIEENKLDS